MRMSSGGLRGERFGRQSPCDGLVGDPAEVTNVHREDVDGPDGRNRARPSKGHEGLEFYYNFLLLKIMASGKALAFFKASFWPPSGQ